MLEYSSVVVALDVTVQFSLVGFQDVTVQFSSVFTSMLQSSFLDMSLWALRTHRGASRVEGAQQKYTQIDTNTNKSKHLY